MVSALECVSSLIRKEIVLVQPHSTHLHDAAGFFIRSEARSECCSALLMTVAFGTWRKGNLNCELCREDLSEQHLDSVRKAVAVSAQKEVASHHCNVSLKQ